MASLSLRPISVIYYHSSRWKIVKKTCGKRRRHEKKSGTTFSRQKVFFSHFHQTFLCSFRYGLNRHIPFQKSSFEIEQLRWYKTQFFFVKNLLFVNIHELHFFQYFSKIVRWSKNLLFEIQLKSVVYFLKYFISGDFPKEKLRA